MPIAYGSLLLYNAKVRFLLIYNSHMLSQLSWSLYHLHAFKTCSGDPLRQRVLVFGFSFTDFISDKSRVVFLSTHDPGRDTLHYDLPRLLFYFKCPSDVPLTIYSCRPALRPYSEDMWTESKAVVTGYLWLIENVYGDVARRQVQQPSLKALL